PAQVGGRQVTGRVLQVGGLARDGPPVLRARRRAGVAHRDGGQLAGEAEPVAGVQRPAQVHGLTEVGDRHRQRTLAVLTEVRDGGLDRDSSGVARLTGLTRLVRGARDGGGGGDGVPLTGLLAVGDDQAGGVGAVGRVGVRRLGAGRRVAVTEVPLVGDDLPALGRDGGTVEGELQLAVAL